jgi:ketosteroid isomerase-like protein
MIKGIHVYKRQADGSWQMAQDVWNSDQDYQ